MEEDKKRSINLTELFYLGLLVTLLAIVVFFLVRPRVGMVDGSRVARELGFERDFTDNVKDEERRAADDMKKLQQKLTEQIAALKQKLADAETDEDKAAIEKETRDANLAYQRKLAALREQLGTHSREKIASFRARLQPFVDKVARRKHLWVVMERTGVIYVVRQADITDDVIEAAKGSFAKERRALDKPAPIVPAE